MAEIDKEAIEKELRIEVGQLKQTLEIYIFNAIWSCPPHAVVKDLAVPERKLYAAVMSYLVGE